MRTHGQAVQDQFDAQAQAYLSSAVHAQGPDLEHARGLLERVPVPRAAALDVGCGAGHLSFALAPAFKRVVALDLSPGMLRTVAQAAATRGLPQIETRTGGSEALPFEDGSFDLAATRFSAHHWRSLDVGLQEMCRVLKPSGRALVIDTLGEEDPLVDTHLQAIELLRDSSHVRNRSADQWRGLLEAAGFLDIEHTQWPLRLEFASWVERMRTPPARVAVIRELQQGAAREVQDALAYEADGSFTFRVGSFWARKPG
jgi:ubiquinone/menaquinone biosynthesis C-methylase UbiE